MKKQFSWMTILMVAVVSVSLVSCGDDEKTPDDTPVDPLGLCPDNHHPHKIDLGVGVKFACCNVGATSPIECGDYFAWGETTTKSRYDVGTYKWCRGANRTLTKYNSYSGNGTVDNKTQLELSDDAARANWGSTWRMPTADELEKLNNNCTWIWTTLNDVSGYKVTGSNGNSIFLPAAGCNYGDSGLDSDGDFGLYWSSSLSSSVYNSETAFYLEIYSNFHGVYTGWGRDSGLSVRPVTE